ncbi:xanthine dehydrogenase family protein molybdopterin-binding subunit [Streptomyces sp. NPDC053431]|uniref:xanthine dehydrogenase family protein molybdopterin-binding subunit n=1 Tax=Streptomyces sp. NPDC053431 TaxID=3365703 RepID=UPI0037D5997A
MTNAMKDNSCRQNADRFLAGDGTYLPDIVLPGMKHATFVRSPHPHARIRAVDGARALTVPGVQAVLSGPDFARQTRRVAHLMPTPPFQPLAWPLLPIDKVRYVGDPVAVVVADDPYTAQDAAELVQVSYEELPWVTSPQEAAAKEAPLLYEEWGSNVFMRDTFQHGDVDAAFATAAGILDERFDHHRMCGFPLEGHGVCAYREPSGRLIVYASTQFPHQLRDVLADITDTRLTSIRVVSPDVGGGFGLKQHVTREELVIAVLALMLPYPVRWTRDVTSLLDHGIHARQQVHEVKAAYRTDGKILALRAHIVADVGNPLLYFTGAGPALVTASTLTGAYDVRAYAFELEAVATNTVPIGGYRGFGQPQAVFTMERTLDLIAQRLAMDPAQIRRVNLIPDQPRPFISSTGLSYDTGSIRGQFDRLLETTRSKTNSFGSADRGSDTYTGVGFACYIEVNAPNVHSLAGRYGAFETATIAIQPDGCIIGCVGTKDIGQGNAATFAQIIADELEASIDDVVIRDGDTDLLPLGMGTMGSRTLIMTGAALRDAAHQVKAKLATLAAYQLGVSSETVRFHGGACHAPGKKAVSYQDLATLAYHTPHLLPPEIEPGLMATGVFHARHAASAPDADGRMNPAATYSSQVAAATVHVEPCSGQIMVTDFTLVHDCGTAVNPIAVQGQIQGSFAQGLSAVLFEELKYEAGRPANATLANYPVARASDIPRVDAVEQNTPSNLPGGVRGIGQVATILAPAAIANAVDNALRPLGITIRQSDLTPSALRRLIGKADAHTNPVAGAAWLEGLFIDVDTSQLSTEDPSAD